MRQSDRSHLRTAKPSKGTVRHGVRLADLSLDSHVGDHVTVVAVCHRSFKDRLTQVLTPSPIVVNMRIQTNQSSVVVEPDLVLGGKRMSLTSRNHVLVSIEHTSHWSTGLVSCNRHLSGETNGSTLFASKSTSQSPDPGGDTVLGDSES